MSPWHHVSSRRASGERQLGCISQGVVGELGLHMRSLFSPLLERTVLPH